MHPCLTIAPEVLLQFLLYLQGFNRKTYENASSVPDGTILHHQSSSEKPNLKKTKNSTETMMNKEDMCPGKLGIILTNANASIAQRMNV